MTFKSSADKPFYKSKKWVTALTLMVGAIIMQALGADVSIVLALATGTATAATVGVGGQAWEDRERARLGQ